MISFKEELETIFGDRLLSYVQEGDELIEYRLKPFHIATKDELALVDALPRGVRAEIDELKAKIADYDGLKARIEELEKK